jgi:hypothetical protein
MLKMAWVPYGEGIHHCLGLATSSHNHYQHHVDHHPYQQENRISACLLRVLLDGAQEILCGETPFPVAKQNNHLAFSEQESMTLTEHGHHHEDQGRLSVNANETSHNETNGDLHDHLQNNP